MKINFVLWQDIKQAWDSRPKEITIGASELIVIGFIIAMIVVAGSAFLRLGGILH